MYQEFRINFVLYFCGDQVVVFVYKQASAIIIQVSIFSYYDIKYLFECLPSNASSVTVCKASPVISSSFSFGPKAPRIWSVKTPEGSNILADRVRSDASPETTDPNRNLYFSIVGQLYNGKK